MKKKSLILFFFLLNILLYSQGYEPRIEIQSSHLQRVSSMKIGNESSWLFSAGEDGSVKIWNKENRELFRQFMISESRIIEMKLHPVDREIALLIAEETGRYYISVWNWDSVSEISKIQLEEKPLYFDYSAKGKYLFYCTTGLPSINMVDSKTGRHFSYLDQHYGLASYAYIGTSENTLMTYSSSGLLEYLNIRSGTQQMRVRTQQDLQNIHVSSDKKYLLARKEDTVLTVDRISGDIEDSIRISGLIFFDYDPVSDFFICISEDRIQFFKYYDGGLERQTFYPDTIPEDISSLVVGAGVAYCGMESGEILYFYRDGHVRSFAKNHLATVEDIFLDDQYTGIITDQYVYLYPSGIFYEEETRETITEPVILENPIQGSTRVINQGNTLLLWNNDDSRGRIVEMDLQTGEIVREMHSSFLYSLREVKISHNLLLTLQSNGRCSIYQADDWEQIYSYSAFGIETIEAISENEIILGKTASQDPMIYINIVTGETIPLNKDNFIIYRIEEAKEEGAIFILGITQGENNEVNTVWEYYFGDLLADSRLISSFEGENLNTDMVVDQDRGYCFSTLGNGILRWNGFRVNRFSDRNHSPQQLFYNNESLVTINRNSSITLWNSRTGAPLLDIYLFDDHSWVGISRGRIVASSNNDAEMHINLYYGDQGFIGLRE